MTNRFPGRESFATGRLRRLREVALRGRTCGASLDLLRFRSELGDVQTECFQRRTEIDGRREQPFEQVAELGEPSCTVTIVKCSGRTSPAAISSRASGVDAVASGRGTQRVHARRCSRPSGSCCGRCRPCRCAWASSCSIVARPGSTSRIARPTVATNARTSSYVGPSSERDVDLHAVASRTSSRTRAAATRRARSRRDARRRARRRSRSADWGRGRRRGSRVDRCGCTAVQRVELDAAEVRDVEQGGDVVDHEEVDLSGPTLSARDGAPRDPVRRVRRSVLLVELVSRHTVRHPLHRERTFGEVGEDQLGDVVVVGEQVALGVAVVRPEDLRGGWRDGRGGRRARTTSARPVW